MDCALALANDIFDLASGRASCTHLPFCAKNIERIGDHATNIAETVYYLVEGHALGDNRPKSDMITA